MKQPSGLIVCILFLTLILTNTTVVGDTIQEAIKAQSAINTDNASSQDKVNRLETQSQKLLEKYRQTLRQTDNLRIYNDNLNKLIDSQNSEISSLNKQLGEIDATNQGIVPLMIRMVDTLEQFIKLDVPFLLDERTQRITSLKQLLVDANITTSEKYRRIMEAYQIETEYGRTIETYQGTLSDNGNKRTVDFLRIGRLSLVYQSLDGKQAYVWDHSGKTWNELPGDYAGEINKGIRIAKKQSAPELLTMPVQADKAVK